MGFNGDTGIASANSTVFAFPNIKSELNQAIDEHQISVKNTRSLIDTKYKWIHGGTIPNVWVQPHNNLESSERTKSLRVKTITGQCCNNYNDHYNEYSTGTNCCNVFSNSIIDTNIPKKITEQNFLRLV